MIGICIKAGFTCPSCESFVPMNAFVKMISCPACMTDHKLTVDHWKTVLDGAVKEAPHSEEGEGSNSTVFGNFNYRIEYGRLKPRYEGTKDDIPIERILENLDEGYVTHPETGDRTPVRMFPDLYSGAFAGISVLIGEDTSMIPQDGEGSEVQTKNSSSPVALQCPNCGGSLIVDGINRIETCSYCDTKVHLPDDLWGILHPVRRAVRWYLLIDYSNIPFVWESEIYGAVAAGNGGVCLVVYNDYGDMPIISCLKPDGTQVWMRDDLEVRCEPEGYVPGIVADCCGNVLIMHENERDLYSISLEDGSVARLIKGAAATGELNECPESLNMTEVKGMTCFPDGSILLLRSSDNEAGYYHELVRFDSEGNPLPLWERKKEPVEKKPGFLARLFKWRIRNPLSRGIPYFDDMGDRPQKLNDSSIDLAAGMDGSLYMLHNERLAAFDSYGMMRYSVEIPCRSTWGRPVANSAGDAFILTESDDDKYQIHTISPDGEVSVYAASIKDGGKVDDTTLIVLASDGKIHALGYGGVWITIDEFDVPAEDIPRTEE